MTEPEISFQYKQVIDDSNLQPASLYLGGKKVATESTVGEGFDIDAITENLAEGGNYSYFIRAQGSNGEDKYTVSSYLSPNNVQGFTADSDLSLIHILDTGRWILSRPGQAAARRRGLFSRGRRARQLALNGMIMDGERPGGYEMCIRDSAGGEPGTIQGDRP